MDPLVVRGPIRGQRYRGKRVSDPGYKGNNKGGSMVYYLTSAHGDANVGYNTSEELRFNPRVVKSVPNANPRKSCSDILMAACPKEREGGGGGYYLL